MKIIKDFALILALLISTINSSMAESVVAEATTFKNTVHAMQLCESGSSLTNCVNPVTIGNSTAMALTGPIPGNMPITVPRKTPNKTNRIF